ncbi:hypothetical protein VTN96DRAFT_4732 [Rasamsonia emersonii]
MVTTLAESNITNSVLQQLGLYGKNSNEDVCSSQSTSLRHHNAKHHCNWRISPNLPLTILHDGVHEAPSIIYTINDHPSIHP